MTTSARKGTKGSWLPFSLFSPFPEVAHGVFLRTGGVSKPPYDSLNLSFLVGDDPKLVEENHNIVKESLGVSSLAWGKQVHDTTIHEVTNEGPLIFDACDGLITTERDVGLLINHADCQAALFYDPKNKIIGAAHAGWKGNVKQFYTKMVERFVAMGSHPRDILVCISPSLGPDHAEFINYEEEFPPSFWPFQVKTNYFDLWAIAKRELLDAGIYDDHIEFASICTACASDQFFSYRREKVTGRNGTVIALKS